MSPRVRDFRLLAALVVVPLGLIDLALAAAIPFVASDDPTLLMVLVGIPLLVVALVVFVCAYGIWNTRLAIGESGVRIRMPLWWRFPFMPVRRVEAAWNEVVGVRHRLYLYSVFPFAFPYPVHLYAVDTKRGRGLFGGNDAGNLGVIAREIAAHAGVALIDEGEVRRSGREAWRVLLRRSPDWSEP